MSDKVTIADLVEAKSQGRRIVAVSCYDYTTAQIVEKAGVEMILVGDSAAQIVLGRDSTLPATMDFMVAITAGVRRGAPNAFLVADMPFLSYQTCIPDALRNAGRFFAGAGAQMVKIEATRAYLDVIRAVSDAGMAVMAHIGIRPQAIAKVGRFKAEATTAEMAADLISCADAMVAAGASCLLIEGTAAEVSQIITQRSPVPVISCGSGPGCDGQILVAPDILGMGTGPTPKFTKAYANIAESAERAFKTYAEEVRAKKYPDDAHSYHMKKGETDRLRKLLEASKP